MMRREGIQPPLDDQGTPERANWRVYLLRSGTRYGTCLDTLLDSTRNLRKFFFDFRAVCWSAPAPTAGDKILTISDSYELTASANSD